MVLASSGKRRKTLCPWSGPSGVLNDSMTDTPGQGVAAAVLGWRPLADVSVMSCEVRIDLSILDW